MFLRHWNHHILPHWEKKINENYPRIGLQYDAKNGLLRNFRCTLQPTDTESTPIIHQQLAHCVLHHNLILRVGQILARHAQAALAEICPLVRRALLCDNVFFGSTLRFL